jgi:hypothetical protein
VASANDPAAMYAEREVLNSEGIFLPANFAILPYVCFNWLFHLKPPQRAALAFKPASPRSINIMPPYKQNLTAYYLASL